MEFSTKTVKIVTFQYKLYKHMKKFRDISITQYDTNEEISKKFIRT